MIKKLLIFLALLAAGFFVLFSFIEERNRPGIKPSRTGTEQEAGPGIKVRQMEVRPSGRLYIPVKREVELSKGRMKLLPVYDLRAEDSEPRPNNTQLLKKVLVEFYEIDDTHTEPRAKLTGWMTADRALLHLSQDDKGRVMVTQDKQMEFWAVKFSTTPDASIPNAEIAIEHAIAVSAVDELRLWTPTDDVPVSVVARGPDGFKVNGLGIRAYIPAHRGKKGTVAVQKQGVFRFTIASQPVLVRDNTTLKSRGPLEYHEDMAAGVANVSMRDQVELRGLTTGGQLDRWGRAKQPSKDSTGQSTDSRPSTVALVARGRRLDAVLTRSDPEGRRSKGKRGEGKQADTTMVWTRIILRGSPARLEGNDMRLTCDRVDVLPDFAGDPYWITASGSANPPTMYQDSQQTKITATNYIHLIRPLHKHIALLSGYGLPAVATPKDYGQLAIFEGPATLIAEQDGITATAARGLVATRGETNTRGENTPTTFFGKGKVHLESPEWIVDGNDGFRLREVPLARITAAKASQRPAVNRFLRLGPDRAGGAHAYRIERLPSPTKTDAKALPKTIADIERLVTTGSGTCHLTLGADGSGKLRLDSKREDVRVLLGDDRGELQRIRTLSVNFHDKHGVLGLIASGRDCPLRYQMEKSGWVVGNAAEIHVPAPGVLRLVGKPRARVHQEKPLRVLEGREILLQRLGEKVALVHCTGDARMRIRQERIADSDSNKDSNKPLAPSGDQDIELLADDIRLLPYLETPTGWHAHTRGLPAFAGSVLAYGHRAPYLFATGTVRLIQRDVEDKVVGRGFGEHLVLRFEDAARSVDGRLSGKNSKLIRIDKNGSTHIAEARIIRFANDPSGEHLDLVKVGDFYPRVTLPSTSPSSSAGNQQANPKNGDPGATLVICKGHIAITPGKVRFLGPMEAQAMDRNGQIDPQGLHMTAASMLMDRDPQTGEVTYIQASRDIQFRIQDMDGEADEMSVDLRRTMIVARGTGRHAVLRQANGRIIKAAQVNHNYRTKQTQSWNGRIVQAITPK